MYTVFKAGMVTLLMLCAVNAKAQSTDTTLHAQQDTLKYSLIMLPVITNQPSPVLNLPTYSQGLFCDFEDALNRKRTLRIDFSVR